jgi:hypothetical protein
MPLAMLDYVGPESSFLVTLTLLSVLLITLIALNFQSWIVLTLGLLLSAINIREKRESR